MATVDSTIRSNWKVTYDPDGDALVIVDHGGDIMEEVSMSWSQQVDDAGYTGSPGMDYFGRGKVSMPFSLAVLDAHADDAAMRNWILDTLAGLPVGEKKPLRIEVKDGDSYQADNAVLESVNPVPVTNGLGPETVTSWALRCSPFYKLP